MDSDNIRIGVIIGLEESGGEGILVVEDEEAKDIVSSTSRGQPSI